MGLEVIGLSLLAAGVAGTTMHYGLKSMTPDKPKAPKQPSEEEIARRAEELRLEEAEAAKKTRKESIYRAASMKGRSSTILSGPQGAPGEAKTGAKTLLGS